MVGSLEDDGDRVSSRLSASLTSMSERPITLLIAAMGGEGGGVFTDWIVKAAEHAGLLVQSTSIPGVAQRTGATTYYVEIFPLPIADLKGRQPVFSLYPGAGDVDLMIATELLEAARAARNGYVSPDRTTLIASPHRVFTIDERTAMGDGRLDPAELRKALQEMSKLCLLHDFFAAAETSGSPINAVLLGALFSSAVLPIEKKSFVAAIEKGGKAVKSNLAGFEAGIVLSSRGDQPELLTNSAPEENVPESLPFLQKIPLKYTGLRDVTILGIERLMQYQGRKYCRKYLDRVERVLEVDGSQDKHVTTEFARELALWMSYEDVIRVAQIKSSASRMQNIRSEIKAPSGVPVKISEFLKPGIEELCSLLPRFMAAPLLRTCRKNGLIRRLNIGISLRTTTISGFLILWLLSRVKFLRPIGSRYWEEQERIDEWVGDVRRAARIDSDLAESVVELARLIKGYGETHHRGVQNYMRIRQGLVTKALDGLGESEVGGRAIKVAVEAALADPEGKTLDSQLAPSS